jgi:hypothetical protein
VLVVGSFLLPKLSMAFSQKSLIISVRSLYNKIFFLDKQMSKPVSITFLQIPGSVADLDITLTQLSINQIQQQLFKMSGPKSNPVHHKFYTKNFPRVVVKYALKIF